MDKNFEQKRFFLTAKGSHRNAHDIKGLLKRITFYDKYYANVNEFDLLASVLSIFEGYILTVNVR